MFFTSISSLLTAQLKMKKIALPAKAHIFKYMRPNKIDVGTILNISKKDGSLTVEAAIVFPLFLLVLLCTSSFISILGINSSLQIRLEETARYYNTYAYITSNESSETLNSTLTTLSLKDFFFNEDIVALCESSLFLKNDINELHFKHTILDNDQQVHALNITYNICIPFIPDNLINFSFTQNTVFKLFTGIEHTMQSDNHDRTVYITPAGNVYHTQKYCTYLKKYTDCISASALDSYETKTNKKFKPCSYCKQHYKNSDITSVYISTYGTYYHYNPDCYHLNQSVYSVKKQDLPDFYKSCHRCCSN